MTSCGRRFADVGRLLSVKSDQSTTIIVICKCACLLAFSHEQFKIQSQTDIFLINPLSEVVVFISEKKVDPLFMQILFVLKLSLAEIMFAVSLTASFSLYKLWRLHLICQISVGPQLASHPVVMIKPSHVICTC